jgi:predicted nucleotidyltransferase
MDKRRAFKIASDYLSFLINEKKLRINKAYLFGSYSKGTFTKDSDIDLAIVMPDINDIIETQIQLMVLRRNFSIDIEPHPFNESDFNYSNPLASEILHNGIELPLKSDT